MSQECLILFTDVEQLIGCSLVGCGWVARMHARVGSVDDHIMHKHVSHAAIALWFAMGYILGVLSVDKGVSRCYKLFQSTAVLSPVNKPYCRVSEWLHWQNA